MKIEIWSDVVCPWCYIGKRRFETALAQFEHKEQVEIIWRSYQLDPQSPRASQQTVNEVLAQKYGVGLAGAAEMNDRVSTLAAQEGLEYHLEHARHSNTFDAHRLIHLAASHHLQGAMEERLFKAYFTDGIAVGETEELVKLAVEVGIDADEARAALTDWPARSPDPCATDPATSPRSPRARSGWPADATPSAPRASPPRAGPPPQKRGPPQHPKYAPA